MRRCFASGREPPDGFFEAKKLKEAGVGRR